MKLKGRMTIELTDSNTGAVETVTEENMITEAVNDLFAYNPFGVHYTTGETINEVEWYKTMLPICPKLIGGILLFSKVLTEDAANIFPPAHNLPVAYASNNVNSTADVARGSLNQSESKALDNGYKFVWEFTPSQGNGTIAAAALTSCWGGVNAFGSSAGTKATFQMMKRVDIGDVPDARKQMLFNAVAFDWEKEILTSITFKDSAVVIRKLRVPTFTIGLNEQLNDSTTSIIEEKSVTTTSFVWGDDYSVWGDFFDGGDGCWYGFSSEGNSSGNATVTWVKIKKDDLTVTDGSWTLTKAYLHRIGTRDEATSYPERTIYSVMRGGYLYVLAYNKKGIYKINANNQTDVTLIPFGFTSAFKPLCESGSCEVYMTVVNGLIMGWDFILDPADKVKKVTGAVRLEDEASPIFQYKNFLVQWGGSYGNEYRTVYILTPYLASINNLSQTVEKTAEKTMKITYTLTQEAETPAP